MTECIVKLVGTEIQNRGEVHTWTTTDPDPASYKRLVPKRLDVPFVREQRDEASGTQRSSYLTVIIYTEVHEVHTGIVFNVREVATHHDFVADNVDDLVAYADERGMKLWASMNSINIWESVVQKTAAPTEMRDWLESGSENAVRVNDTDYKKAIFVRECTASDPAELVQEMKAELLKLSTSQSVASYLVLSRSICPAELPSPGENRQE